MLIEEFCAENMTLVPAAVASGAQRIELCDNLAVGGTTPSYGVIKSSASFARAHDVKVMTMVRPRGGSFVYDEPEAHIMLEDIACARELGVSGVVFGCLRHNEAGCLSLDEELTKRLVDAAKESRNVAPLAVTFHMAFDAMAEQEQFRAVNTLADLGVERILTHGGPLSTPIVDNIPHLQKLIAHARGRIAILPGGGISWKNAKDIAKLLGVCEVHGSKVVCI
jgi:copper homeostasis protein